jgi:hypothetical protein
MAATPMGPNHPINKASRYPLVWGIKRFIETPWVKTAGILEVI